MHSHEALSRALITERSPQPLAPRPRVARLRRRAARAHQGLISIDSPRLRADDRLKKAEQPVVFKCIPNPIMLCAVDQRRQWFGLDKGGQRAGSVIQVAGKKDAGDILRSRFRKMFQKRGRQTGDTRLQYGQGEDVPPGPVRRICGIQAPDQRLAGIVVMGTQQQVSILAEIVPLRYLTAEAGFSLPKAGRAFPSRFHNSERPSSSLCALLLIVASLGAFFRGDAQENRLAAANCTCKHILFSFSAKETQRSYEQLHASKIG